MSSLSELYSSFDAQKSLGLDIQELEEKIKLKEEEVLSKEIIPSLEEITNILLQSFRKDVKLVIDHKVGENAKITIFKNDVLLSEKGLIKSVERFLKPIMSNCTTPITLCVDYSPDKGIIVRKESKGKIKKLPVNDNTLISDSSDIVVNNEIILTHPIDWSLFEYGFTVDKQYHEAVFKSIGQYIPRGKGVNIRIIIDDNVFEAKLANADSKGRKGDTIRLLYRRKNNNLGIYLKDHYPEIYEFIKSYKEQQGGRKQCILPNDLCKQLIMKQTSEALTFRVTIEDY